MGTSRGSECGVHTAACEHTGVGKHTSVDIWISVVRWGSGPMG